MASSLGSLVWQTPSLFSHSAGGAWTSSTTGLAAATAALYVTAVFLGRRWMRDRAAAEFRGALLIWNGALALFSCAGSAVLVPETVQSVGKWGLRGSWCRRGDFFEGVSGYWAFLFLVSKVVELGDTAFLVARKRPVIFLHWYHHVTVMLWMWVSYPAGCAAMRWGITMNYVVHTIMYSYFTARAAGLRLPKPVASAITSLQMLQFLVAIAITLDVLAALFSHSPNTGCQDNSKLVILGQSALYFTYLILFANFFLKSYCRKRTKTE